jgi:hypothetical protein
VLDEIFYRNFATVQNKEGLHILQLIKRCGSAAVLDN